MIDKDLFLNVITKIDDDDVKSDMIQLYELISSSPVISGKFYKFLNTVIKANKDLGLIKFINEEYINKKEMNTVASVLMDVMKGITVSLDSYVKNMERMKNSVSTLNINTSTELVQMDITENLDFLNYSNTKGVSAKICRVINDV